MIPCPQLVSLLSKTFGVYIFLHHPAIPCYSQALSLHFLLNQAPPLYIFFAFSVTHLSDVISGACSAELTWKQLK